MAEKEKGEIFKLTPAKHSPMRMQDSLVTLIAFFVGVILFVLSIISLYTDYQLERPPENIAIDVLFLIFSSILIGGSLNLRKRLVGYEVSANAAFNEIIYSKLRPVLEEVAVAIVEINRLSKRMESVENKISVIEDLATTQKLTPEQKINFYFKSIVVMVFYIGIFIFITQYVLPYDHILSSLLFIVWWGFITTEFRLFDRSEALIMLIAPPLVVPSLYLILRTLAGIAITQGVIFVASAVYAYYYYMLAKNIRSQERESLKGKIKNTLSKMFSKSQ